MRLRPAAAARGSSRKHRRADYRRREQTDRLRETTAGSANGRLGRLEQLDSRNEHDTRCDAYDAHDERSGTGAANRSRVQRRKVDRNRSRGDATLEPPQPPIELTPLVACDPNTPMEVLWHIAREIPELRRWLVAHPQADAALLEYVAQAGGPGVNEALTVLLDG